MNKRYYLLQTGFLSLILTLFLLPEAKAQIQEPEVVEVPRDLITLSDEYSSGFGISVNMNNFGFGLGGEYRKVVAPQSEIIFKLGFTGLRDESEQTFTDFFFGQQIVPNKFQRGLAFPLMAGFRQRIFPDIIQENYRFFVSASAGPVAAFTYPYFDDSNGNGYRETGNEYQFFEDNGELFVRFAQPERVNDVFSGMGDGDWHWGAAGELKIGVDIGSNFSRLNSIEFGYYFYYFADGIQMMQPNQPVIQERTGPNQSPYVWENGQLVVEEFFEPQKFFGTPQITFTFGWLW
ncbi:hypothetical protein [Rhodohalobacter barkolensis]|uniref:Uncharacterized protein n=1 Tax=Rhodohalobacter barkolensis TaxID=2053187 RepID=A0A2N0VED4_9BACT|nr:hypothetical protein [Rhodohalobacter barkolensis]PKD42543.1 hypothetical protein CWD77_14110 [Rhodohalobacter barkolensis]